MSRRWRRATGGYRGTVRTLRSLPRFDVLLALLIATGNVVAAIAEDSFLPAVHLPAALVGGLCLAWRRRAPFVVLGIVLATDVAAAVAGGSSANASILVAVFTVASRPEPGRRTFVALALAIVTEAVFAGGPFDFELALVAVVLLLLDAGAGIWVGVRRARLDGLRERAERAEREREILARNAVVEERLRIAREVHDVVAHNVSVIVVQAAAAADGFDRDPARGKEALERIEGVGRRALADLRSVVGTLRDGADDASTPLPGLAGLDALADDVRAAGLRVRLAVEGDLGDVPEAVGLSAYRIVQEALTNTLRHARAQEAQVHVRRSADGVAIDVIDDGVGVPGAAAGGRGLVGMHERAAAYGGTVEFGARPEGGFAVRARLPVGAGP